METGCQKWELPDSSFPSNFLWQVVSFISGGGVMPVFV